MKKTIDSIFYDLKHELITEEQAHQQVINLFANSFIINNKLKNMETSTTALIKSVSIKLREIDNGFIVTEKGKEIYYSGMREIWEKYFMQNPADLGIDKDGVIMTLDISKI